MTYLAEMLRTIRRNNHRDTGELIDPTALAEELSEVAEVLASVAQVAVDSDILDRAGALTAPMIANVGRYPSRVRRRVGSIRGGTRASHGGLSIPGDRVLAVGLGDLYADAEPEPSG